MTPGKTHDDSGPHRQDDSTGDSRPNRQDGSTGDSQPHRQDGLADDRQPHRQSNLPDDPLAPLASPVSTGAVESPDSGGTSGETTSGTRSGATSGSPDDTARFALLAIIPAIATLAGLALGSVFGFGVFDTRTPGFGRSVAYALLVPYFLLGVAGTRWLYEDATRLATAGADWQPNPWRYVLGGGLSLELYYLVPVLNGAGPETGVVPYLAGGFVLALVLSSVVAGPVYVLQRRRHLDRSEDTPR